MQDKRFCEEDVLAYAESLKAPAVQEKKDKLMKVRAEAQSMNTLLTSLLKVVPQPEATERVLKKWLDKYSDSDMETLCNDIRAALERIAAEKVLSTENTSQTEPRQRNSVLAPLHYYVQGSALEPYLVTFKREGEHLAASCSCPAGRMGKTFCKHVAWVLKGDPFILADGSDELATLASRASGSPLLEKAKEYKFVERQKLPALTGVASVKDLIPLVDSMLSKTELWSEYTTDEDGAEFLIIYLRKMYKNGKPYKNPTQLLSISHELFMTEFTYNETTHRMEEKRCKRIRQYSFDSINYGKIETAGANFLKKLEEIISSNIN